MENKTPAKYFIPMTTLNVLVKPALWEDVCSSTMINDQMSALMVDHTASWNIQVKYELYVKNEDEKGSKFGATSYRTRRRVEIDSRIRENESMFKMFGKRSIRRGSH